MKKTLIYAGSLLLAAAIVAGGVHAKNRNTDISRNILIFNDGVQITSSYPDNLDVIYFDVQMPVMDGMTAAKKIHQHD